MRPLNSMFSEWRIFHILLALLLTSCTQRVLRQVAITSEPPGAKIEVNGAYVGDTPLTVEVPITQAGPGGCANFDPAQWVIVDREVNQRLYIRALPLYPGQKVQTKFLTKGTIARRDITNIYFNMRHKTRSAGSKPPTGGSLKSSGSGLVISADGLVVTCFHVVDGASKIEIAFPEKRITKSASVRIRDTKNDIAILQVEGFLYSEISSQAIPFALADPVSAKLGQEVFTLGFPLGEVMGTTPRLSTGCISSLFGLQDDPRLFQVSNPLQPGNSGGALFNSRGELVGVVVSGLNARYLYENAGIIPQNVNFAIKASYLQSLILMLPEGEKVVGRKNLIRKAALEDRIEQLVPFVVQVRTY